MNVAIILFGIVVMFSCTHKSQEATLSVSFNSDILPIFEANCAINSSCHLGANNANDEIDLDTSAAYNTIISKHLVATGNPSASLLYSEISNGIMPKSPYPPLSSDKINLVLNWIKQGALNN